MARHRARTARRRALGCALALLVAAVAAGLLLIGPGSDRTVGALAAESLLPGSPASASASAAEPGPAIDPETRAATPPRTAPARLTDRLVTVPGTSRRVGKGPVFRYSIEVQEGLAADPDAFARAVEEILYDRRGWTADDALALQRVPPDRADFRVALASPKLVDERCRPLDTEGIYSCFNGTRAMINHMRWTQGADAYGDNLTGYRQYLISHEVGHALDHRHERCPTKGARSPVMVQQTIGTQGCRANPWPHPDAR